jgi:predicted alpha/beta-hydrolase family hydrolase
VLASGQGYHMALPALKDTARRLIENGVAVYRFNWAYFTKDPASLVPSDDLSSELQDLEAVVALARSDRRVDQSRLSIGGKSLGSRVAWRAFRKDGSIRSGLFLTPVCSEIQGAKTVPNALSNYPGISEEHRPIGFIAGDRDPLCASGVLYDFAARAGGTARVAIVGGNHGFQEPALSGFAQKSAQERTIAAVAQLVTNFVLDTLQQ